MCSGDAARSITVDSSMISIRPLGSAAAQSPIWLKKKGKEKRKTKSLKSKQGGHTCFNDRYFFKACFRLGDNVL